MKQRDLYSLGAGLDGFRWVKPAASLKRGGGAAALRLGGVSAG